MSQTDLAILEGLDEVDVEVAINVCVNMLRLLRERMLIWEARVEDSEGVGAISNMRKNRALNPYCSPIILWSVEKIYFFQKGNSS